uniref:Major capsid protein N-terminal domain-containing protein n=1 Tax=viral metagenome TaxID=1070528 RepID=A0A6C0CGM2_9ZZZZ
MGGGLLQLVAYGAQDVYLTGNPQITFFKVVYRRHTNFAMEAIQQTFSGTVNFGGTVYCQISRNGDLIHRTYLQVDLPILTTATDSYVNYVGLRLLKAITIEIGGQQIDKHYADWLYIWNELSLPIGKRNAYNNMVGADANLVNVGANSTNGSTTTLFIPFEFWFCRNIGLALPLIALQYHEVRIKIDFAPLTDCVYNNTTGSSAPANITSTIALSNANIWVDYIYLDTDERRKFAQLSHEYLIEQLQFTGPENLSSNTNSIKLNFNHPVKELIWVGKFNGTSGSQQANNQWYNYTWPSIGSQNAATWNSNYGLPSSTLSDYLSIGSAINPTYDNLINGGAANCNISVSNLINYQIDPYFDNFVATCNLNPFNTCLLQLNGNDRFSVRPGNYFNLVQQYQHHTNISQNRGINVYSFALKPEEHQPSGSLNMSRIDTAVLQVTPYQYVSGNILIYAVNYNVLRILSGMGGLAYSN